MVPSIYLINLDKDTSRLRAMSQQLAELCLPFERIEAVSGTNMPSWLRPYFLDDGGQIIANLTPGEVGCYASHLLAIEKAVEQNRPAIVLEDDLRLHAHFRDVLDLAAQLPADLDMLKLTRLGGHRQIPVKTLPSGQTIVKFPRVPLGAGAYLITPAGARKFLEWKTLRTAPIDQDFRRPWDCRLSIYGVEPMPAEQNIGSSTIETFGPLPQQRKFHENHPLVERIQRHVYEVQWLGWRHGLIR